MMRAELHERDQQTPVVALRGIEHKEIRADKLSRTLVEYLPIIVNLEALGGRIRLYMIELLEGTQNDETPKLVSTTEATMILQAIV